jgi:heme iron utilization protein
MDDELSKKMAKVIRSAQRASLGVLHNGAPFVSMVLVAPSNDLCNYYIHISRLAQHTHDIGVDPRVSLLFMEENPDIFDPQQLARVTIVGRAFAVSSGDTDAPEARNRYLERYPASAGYFTFPDFHLYRIRVESGRYVAGFAQAFTLNPQHFLQASQT